MAVKHYFYLSGSEGYINMFFRQKGTEVCVHSGMSYDNYIADKDEWIIQWQGDCCWDSGYSSDHFKDYETALQFFKHLFDQHDYQGKALGQMSGGLILENRYSK